MTATIPSVSLVSHSVFPFCPSTPQSIVLFPLFSTISSLQTSPIYFPLSSLLDCLNWNYVFVSYCSVSNLNRMFMAWLLLWPVQALQVYFCNLSRASLAMLFWVVVFFFLYHGLGIKRRSLISIPLFSLLLQPVSCLLGCFRYMVVWALVWTSAASVRADSWIPLGESVRVRGRKNVWEGLSARSGRRDRERREEEGESSRRIGGEKEKRAASLCKQWEREERLLVICQRVSGWERKS